MIYSKRYLQFNDLVFDGYDMISDFDESVSYKGTSTSYSFRHGSYAPFKNSYMYVEEKSASMTISLYLNKIPCEYREYYVHFVEQELGRPGRLWAIKNNEIIWAWAYVKNISPVFTYKQNYAEYDVEFAIPGGVWHKADKQKTFLLPYDVCTFMECKGYKTLNPCRDEPLGDCCAGLLNAKAYEEMEQVQQDSCFCCCVDAITKDMQLCYHLDELQAFYSCETPYQLVYDCDLAEKFSRAEHLGQKLCTKDACEDSVIAGRFYSETDIPTDEFTLIIDGKATNPWITINGNTNVIEGEFDGVLTIKASGDIYYKHGQCEELLDPGAWVVPSGNDYGWTINPQWNSIIVRLNNCCAGITCVYVQIDNITT